MGSTSDYGRRDLIKRAAALGLIAVPDHELLSACASSDSGDDRQVDKGKKTAKNPLGVKEDAPLEVVIFNGGFGEEYAKDAEAEYKKAYPEGQGQAHRRPRRSSPTLQPRFDGGTPPDLVDNSGAEQMDFGALVGKNAARRPHAAAGRARPSTTRARRSATRCSPASSRWASSTATRCGHVLRLHRLRRLVLAEARSEKLGAEYPKTWDDMLALCAKAKKKGIAPLDVRRASTRTTCRSASTPSSPRSAAARSSRRSTTWSRTPGSTRRSRRPSRRTTSCYQEGLHPQGHPGPGPHPVADRLDRGQGAVHPERLLGGERGGEDHAGGLRDGGRRAPSEPRQRRQAAVRHALGLRRRAVHRPGQGARTRAGGMELLRIMLAEKSAQELHQAGHLAHRVSTAAPTGSTLPPG